MRLNTRAADYSDKKPMFVLWKGEMKGGQTDRNVVTQSLEPKSRISIWQSGYSFIV